MTEPRVYVVNMPLRRDGQRAIDVRGAQRFGELAYVYPPGNPPEDPRHHEATVADRLAGFRECDYILPVGNTVAIAAACAYAARRTAGRLRVLLWDNREHTYTPVELRLWEDPAAGIAA